MRFRYALCGVLAAGLTATAATAGLAGTPSAVRATRTRINDILGESGNGLTDFDARQGTAKWLPSAAAKADLRTLPGTEARWTDFGTVANLQADAPEGWVATGLTGAPATAAREWVRAHRALFNLTDSDVTDLELLNDAVLVDTTAHAVLFRQRFGTLMSAQDGLIMVAMRDGKIALVTSSAVGHGTLAAQPKIGPAQAWVAAAKFTAQPAVTLADVVAAGVEHTGFDLFRVPGYTLPQRARLVAFATRTDGVRPAYETVVANNPANGELEGYVVFVDAVTGAPLFRQNRVQTLAEGWAGPAVDGLAGTDTQTPGGGTFTGKFAKGKCGPVHTFAVTSPPGVIVAGAVTTPTPSGVDTVVRILQGKTVVASGDTVDGPEAATYTPLGSAPAGTYGIQVCAFDSGVAGSDYTAAYAVYDGPSANAYQAPAKWKIFAANPLLASSKDNRIVGCWDASKGPSTTKPVNDCAVSFASLASRQPWDVDPRTLEPTFTTMGNNAHSASAWMAPGEGALAPAPAPAVGAITPAEQYSPVSPTRDYNFAWTDQWRTSTTPQQTAKGCAPSSFISPARVDVDAATANLFAMHNRMHDFAYHLGYTEKNYNHQLANYGNTSPQYEQDPQVGNSQAGAVNGGGPPSYGGRDNANQLTLQDGVSPISNMYLWQPIGASFYASCTDGDYDMSVIGHEYTHAISNRMVGGPDAGIGGEQGGAMGESWSDLVALEFLNAFGYAGRSGEGKGTVGAYVTGDKLDGIRDFNLDKNPLNYGDYAFDTTGAEVHADGEIWNGIQWALRKAWMKTYDHRGYPSGDRKLQVRCATGGLPADKCPGNRRWVQNIFDSFLLMPATVSMVDARDAMLAADKLRFGGKDVRLMWQVFANRGMGKGVDITDANDTEPTPSFVSPYTAPATVKFRLVDDVTGKPVRGNVYVGRFEARVSPLANTVGGDDVGDTAKLAGGTYELVVQGLGYGLHRTSLTVGNGQNRTVTLTLPRNLASKYAGATATGDGIYLSELIDDTENTDWGFFGGVAALPGRQPDPTKTPKPIKNKGVTVNLTGGVSTIDRITVSAAHRPGRTNPEGAPDPAQSRFSTLRQFAIDVSTDGKNFKQVYVSSPSAFPGHKPRPRVPDLIFRDFRLPKPVKASHVRIRVLSNQCIGNPAFVGDQDADPANNADCKLATQASNVTIAELQVYAKHGTAAPSSTSGVIEAVAVARVVHGGPASLSAVPAASRRPLSPASVAVNALVLVATAGATWRVRAR